MSSKISDSFVPNALHFLHTNEMLKALTTSLAACLVSLEESTILGCTPVFADLFGYDSDELLGKHIDKLVPDEYREGHADLVENFRQNPRMIQMGDRRIPGKRKDGTLFTSTIWIIPNGKYALLVAFE